MKHHFVLSRPVAIVAEVITKRVGGCPHVKRYTVAATVVLTGSFMATHPLHFLPHFLWDGLAYTIHGLGAAPIAEGVLRRLAAKKGEQK